MSNTPHELAEEFPDKIDAIHALKISDPHFEKIVDDYQEVNRAIYRAEANLMPTDDLHLSEMRKQRLAVKDEIARALAALPPD